MSSFEVIQGHFLLPNDDLRNYSITDQEIQNFIAPLWAEIGLFWAKSKNFAAKTFKTFEILKTFFLWILGFSAISGRARSIVFFGAFDLTMTNMSIREHFKPSVM